jgi:hypothetical protein
MPAVSESKSKEESVIATLGGFDLPLELDRPEMFGRGETKPVAVRRRARTATPS